VALQPMQIECSGQIPACDTEKRGNPERVKSVSD